MVYHPKSSYSSFCHKNSTLVYARMKNVDLFRPAGPSVIKLMLRKFQDHAEVTKLQASNETDFRLIEEYCRLFNQPKTKTVVNLGTAHIPRNCALRVVAENIACKARVSCSSPVYLDVVVHGQVVDCLCVETSVRRERRQDCS